MDVSTITSFLNGLPVPTLRTFDTIGSTNDEALRWAETDAVDGCLVLADQQTNGRGRFNRRWITQPGAALAFSLVLKPAPDELDRIQLFSPLAVLAAALALEEDLGLSSEIKWPNDLLLNGRKAAGVLVEAAWQGDRLAFLVVGMGINVLRGAVPPADELLFPAISVEDALGSPADRLALLRSVLQRIFTLRARITSPDFLVLWESRLAYRGKWVQVEEAAGQPGAAPVIGQVIGLNSSGNLLLRSESCKEITITAGDVRLRPLPESS